MIRWFVTRHPGARRWAVLQGIAVDRWVEHLCVDDVSPGDCVMGTLPMEAAARVCRKGARFFALCLDHDRTSRGRELKTWEMTRLNGRLVEFRVDFVGTDAQVPGSACAQHPKTS